MSDATEGALSMALFDYDLPESLIAQVPLAERTESRLLHLDRRTGAYGDRQFVDLPELLRPGDLLVFNDTRVIPARLHGRRTSGGKVEFLLLRKLANGSWSALAKPAGKLRVGERIDLTTHDGAATNDAHVTIDSKDRDGLVQVTIEKVVEQQLSSFGEVPLPPYITVELEDADRYQTVFSRIEGSAAAPTAGLHFTEAFLEQIDRRGVERAFVTLHVGLDTFRPVQETNALDHQIHSEWCAVPEETVQAIEAAKNRGGRVIAVGTTAARTLETYGQRVASGMTGAFTADTSIYITPGYQWTMVDGLFTNFHLPKSTLLLMVSAFAGRTAILRAYRHAVGERYRFFSFGDAMVIL